MLAQHRDLRRRRVVDVPEHVRRDRRSTADRARPTSPAACCAGARFSLITRILPLSTSPSTASDSISRSSAEVLGELGRALGPVAPPGAPRRRRARRAASPDRQAAARRGRRVRPPPAIARTGRERAVALRRRPRSGPSAAARGRGRGRRRAIGRQGAQAGADVDVRLGCPAAAALLRGRGSGPAPG